MTATAAVRPPDEVRTLRSLTASDLAQWRALAAVVGAGYFASPLWCRCWLEAFAPTCEEAVGLWRTDGVLAAVAPMVRVRQPLLAERLATRPSVWVWQNVGGGVGSGDHLDFASRPELRASVVAWASGLGGPVRFHSFTASWDSALAGGPKATRHPTTTYRIDLDPETPEPGSRQHWSQIRRRRRRILEQGVTFSTLTGDEVTPELLEALVRLHQERADDTGRTTTFGPDRLPFHRALAEGSDDDHRSVLVAAHHDGELVGGLYGFLDPTTFSYYQSGWSRRFEHWSLGSVLIAESIEAAQARSLPVFDLLRGDDPYKLRFGAHAATDTTTTRYVGSTAPLLALRDAAVRRLRSDPVTATPFAP